ncbi:unnamed protein product [Caenorhabditis brenneri]
MIHPIIQAHKKHLFNFNSVVTIFYGEHFLRHSNHPKNLAISDNPAFCDCYTGNNEALEKLYMEKTACQIDGSVIRITFSESVQRESQPKELRNVTISVWTAN